MDSPMAFLTNNTGMYDDPDLRQACNPSDLQVDFAVAQGQQSLETKPLMMIHVQAGIGLGNSQSYHTCQRHVSATTSLLAHSNCARTQTRCPTLSRYELCATAGTYQDSSGSP